MLKGYIKFWGTRGSNPTPDEDKIKFGGDTSCVEVRTSENDLIIFDMGTGLRNLGKKIISDSSYDTTIHILLSHYHFDHIMGFLTFAPLFDSKYTINIYGDNKDTDIKDLPDMLLQKNFWPVEKEMLKAAINFKRIENNQININGTKITHTLHGHPNGANTYRLEHNNKSMVYCTDCEHPQGSLNPNVVEICNQADIVIHDAHYTINDLINHKGWGHSSWKQAVDVMLTSHAKKLVLFHYSPDYNDNQVWEIEKNAKAKFPNTISSFQGLALDF